MLRAGNSKLFTFQLDFPFGFNEGMICGGAMDVAISIISKPEEACIHRSTADRLRVGVDAILPIQIQGSDGWVEYRLRFTAACKLVIAGGGHISRLLAPMMEPLGFRVSVVDDRQAFANAKRFPPPIQPVQGDIAGTLADWPIDAQTYVVIVTRGHQHDERVLAAVLDSPARYIGMIGSRRKIAVIFNDLKREGATSQQLDRVTAPIGLNIGAVTTEEIALSIAAQLVSVRRQDRNDPVEGPIPIAGMKA